MHLDSYRLHTSQYTKYVFYRSIFKVIKFNAMNRIETIILKYPISEVLMVGDDIRDDVLGAQDAGFQVIC